MKTLKQVPIQIVYVEYIPPEMEQGKLYFSQKYMQTNHLCFCGCGMQAPIPISSFNGDSSDGWVGEWTLEDKNGRVTMTPSLLHRHGCQSHYVIQKGNANFV